MAEIISTNGIKILVDKQDLELVSKHPWTVTPGGYAKKYFEKWNNGKRKRTVITMHRLIMDAEKGQIVDHINQDKLDNRRSNLRFADKSLNAMNSKKASGRTGLRGVIINTQKGKPFMARITQYGRQIHLGRFNTAEEAHEAYLSKQKELTA